MITEIIDGKLIIPEGTEIILEESYYGRNELTELFLPDSLKIVGPAAFCECANLGRVHMSKNLKEIGDGAFLGTAALTELEFPEGLEQIGAMAFWEGGLTRVRIPEGVKSIGESAFWECNNLEQADILGKDTAIGLDAFGSCPRLVRGYAAPGFPAEDYGPSNLLFSLLWASCPERHAARPDICQRAEGFIKSNQKLILEYILTANNTAALTGLLNRGLLMPDIIDDGLKKSVQNGQTELSALFLSTGSAGSSNKAKDISEVLGEFEL